MVNQERQNLIKKISSERGDSFVISYITGDRQPFRTNVAADDTIPIFQRHLIGSSPKKISLFLYTRGGDMIAPLRMVKFLRSYCEYLEVLVPHYAHSAGTLIALGADKIVMGRLGELSPVDPTIMHAFNPEVQVGQQQPAAKQKVPISVEDINSYFLFAKEKAGVPQDKLDRIYEFLVSNNQPEKSVPPLVIGGSYRSYRMARMLAEKLLKLHMRGFFQSYKIKKIVDELTGKISVHNYPITRDEARELGLKIEYADGSLEEDIRKLFEQYAQELKLNVPFNPAEILGDKATNNFAYTGAYIESDDKLDEFLFKGIVNKVEKDGQINIGMNILASHWQKIK